MMNQQIDLARARRETPGCRNVLHFNNAGAALMPQPVLDALLNHLQLEAEIGGYEASDQTGAGQERAYERVAHLLGCRQDEVAIVENATRAWDMAFYAIPFQPGDRILTAQVAYASNYIAFLHMARRCGVQIEMIPNDEHGQVSVSELRQMIDGRVRLIAITHVPTSGGLVNPAAAVGQVAREAGILYLLDACQSVGQMPIDVQAIGCDMLSATGRKFLRGPRGIGFLYVGHEILDQLDPPFLDIRAATWVARNRYEMRPDARRFETWETNVAAKIALGVAVDYAQQWGLEAIWSRNQLLANKLRRQLSSLPGVTIRDQGVVQGAIVTFTVDSVEAAVIQQELRQRRINVTTSTLFSTRLDMEDRQLKEVVRASIHYYNSETEIDRFCELLESLI